MAGKTYIKTGDYTWSRVKKVYLKTGGVTWQAVRKAYIKTGTSTWKKIYDTASNKPFIGNDIPKIRLNTPRTDSGLDFTGTANDPVNPFVEAPPVQQMGPSWTSPTLGWPYESLGAHLWGYNGGWTSGNGSTMTFIYQWLYNLTGNSNNNIFDPQFYVSLTSSSINTSSTGRADMLTNSASYLGYNDGDYFDKNFLTLRVGASNSSGGPIFSESAPVYIVREAPTGSITMISPGTAFTNSSMAASFTYSNYWYNKTNTSNSFIEWFAVNNIGDPLTSTNRVQTETLSSIVVTGTTSKSGTTFHVPTIAGKYYYVKMTLNNSGTENAVIAINGFTPKSPVTAQANKTALTSAPLTAPTISSVTYNGSSVSINFSGGSGPYYELYHSNSPNAADGLLTNFYDAASTSSPLTESIVIAVGTTRYFWLRSSSVNRGNTTASGNAADGTFGPWASSGFAFTAPILDPQAFSTISYVKNFPSSSSGGVVRTTSLSWNASTNATRYEIEYEGSYNNSTWTTVQSFAASAYTSSTSQSVSWGSPIPAGGFDYYTYMRARVRASNTTSATQVIGDNPSSLGNIYAAGSNPDQPTFGTITYNLAGTTASISVTIGNSGSNYFSNPVIEYQYRTSSGSYSGTWLSTNALNLTGLTPSITYYIKIRTRNEDQIVSPENETSFNTPAASVAPTGGSASIGGLTPVGSVLTLTKTDATGSPNPTPTWLWRIADGGFGGNTFTGGTIVQNGGSTYTSQYAGYAVRVEITWSNAVAPAQSVITNSIAVVAAGVAPSGGGVTLTPTGTQQPGTVISANVTAMSGTAPITYVTTIRKATGSSPTGTDTATSPRAGLTNPGTGTGNAVAQHEITTGEASGTPDQFKAYTVGTNSFGNFTVGSNTVISTPAVVTQYTLSYSANGGSTTPTQQQGAQGASITLAANAGTQSGFTFGGWNIVGTTYTGGASYTFGAANATATAIWTSNFVAPTSSAPSMQFSRKTTATTHLQWYCDYPSISGDGTITSMQYEIRTTAGGGTLLASGTRSYPGAGSYPYSAGGTIWAFRMGTTDGDIAYSSSARYGRGRVVMQGSNGTTYYGTWSAWL